MVDGSVKREMGIRHLYLAGVEIDCFPDCIYRINSTVNNDDQLRNEYIRFSQIRL